MSEVVALVQAAPLLADEPDRLRTVLATIEQAGLRSLESLDIAVAAPHDPDPPGQGTGLVQNVVARFNTATSGQLRWWDETGGRPLPHGASSLICRTTVEALTNIRRHAAESAGSVRLAVEPPWIKLTVTNTMTSEPQGSLLSGADRGPDAGGRGLAGLRKQAAEQGGGLTAGPNGADWQVQLRLPLEES